MTKVWPMAHEQAHKTSLFLHLLVGFQEPRRFCNTRKWQSHKLARVRSYITGVALLLSPPAENSHEKLALWCTLAIAALRELSWRELRKFRASLRYRVRPTLTIKKPEKQNCGSFQVLSVPLLSWSNGKNLLLDE